MIQAPDHIKFPMVVPSKTEDYIGPLLNTLSDEQLEHLSEIYFNDMKLFNYGFPDVR